MIYKEQEFNISKLNGISEGQIKTHLELYAGYVKHTNLIRKKIQELENTDKEKNSYITTELRRRFSFEFNGMRMHEYYFSALGRPALGWELKKNSSLKKALAEKYSSWDGFIEHFKMVGKSRGIGWATLYWDTKANTPHTAWVGSHEVGTLAGLPILLVMDMWEHAFMFDYPPSKKGDYIEAFLNNVNWNIVEERFNKVV